MPELKFLVFGLVLCLCVSASGEVPTTQPLPSKDTKFHTIIGTRRPKPPAIEMRLYTEEDTIAPGAPTTLVLGIRNNTRDTQHVFFVD